MFTIDIYRKGECWCFNDEKRELIDEPFVLGSSEMIDSCILSDNLNGEKFTVLFSDKLFPTSNHSLSRLNEECGGFWYRLDDGEMTGWLCPATTLFFDNHPPEIHLKISTNTY